MTKKENNAKFLRLELSKHVSCVVGGVSASADFEFHHHHDSGTKINKWQKKLEKVPRGKLKISPIKCHNFCEQSRDFYSEAG